MSTTMRLWGGCARALVVASALLTAPSAFGQAPAPAAQGQSYDAVISEAVTEFSAGRWGEARALFKRAHRISPNARTLRGMGMCAYELRMYVPALRELQGALQEQRRPLDEAQRIQVNQLIAQAANFIGRYHLKLDPADTTVMVDGKQVQPDPGNLLFLELGDHELEFRREGHAPQKRRLRVEGMENQIIDVKLDPVAASSATAPAPAAAAGATQVSAGTASRDDSSLAMWGWISLGVAAVSGGVAAYAWYAGGVQTDTFQDYCDADVDAGEIRRCTEGAYQELDIELNDTLATAFLVTAAVTGVAGITLITLDALDDGETAGGQARVAIGPGSVQLTGSF